MMNCHAPFQHSFPITSLRGREPEPVPSPARLLAASTRRAHQEVVEARRMQSPHSLSSGLLDDRFQSLDRLVSDYVRSVPPASHAETDTDQFMAWLQDQDRMSAEQRDLLLCLYSRRAVEAAALHKRIAHARFEELLTRTPRRMSAISSDSRMALRLNPVHIWATLQTRALLGRNAEVPTCVLFYQVGRDVRTAILKDDVLPLVRMLEHHDVPLSVIFADLDPQQTEQVTSLVRHLINLQIVALVSP